MFENYSVDLFDTVIHLRQGGEAVPGARSTGPAGRDAGLWSVGAFHADSDRAVHADVWERHPDGYEVLCVLNGEMRVHLRDHADGTVPVATLTPGRSFIVPAGSWHRLSVVQPGDLLTITPRAGTQHERVGTQHEKRGDAAGDRS